MRGRCCRQWKENSLRQALSTAGFSAGGLGSAARKRPEALPPFFKRQRMPSQTRLSRGFVRSLFSFGTMHVVSLLIPLLAFPWLGRALQPECFGLLMYMCLFPPLFTLFVEWGFPLGGARQAARLRGRNQELGRLLSDIVSAKLVLALFSLALSLALLPALPFARDWPGAFILAALAGVAKAMSPLWFYQGTGRGLSLFACVETLFSFLALALVFVFIHQPEQWFLYLLFTGACRLSGNLALTGILLKKYPFSMTFGGAARAIRSCSALFSILFFSNIYHYCFQLVLGYFLTSSEMGVIVAVDKMLRALTGLLNPVTQTIFPEICILSDKNPKSAWRILRLSLILTFLAAAAASAVLWIAAPLVIKIALGDAYQSAPMALRIMLFSVPAAACVQVLGSQALVPFGWEKLQALICGAVSLASVPLSAALAFYYGLAGGAFVPLCVEGGLCLGFLWLLLKKKAAG